MAKEVKQKIVLDGEKQYNAAIREANRNLKTLQSALKAETAEMGKNASEQQKSAARIKSLKQQIQEQEKIVKTCTKALEEARQKYGDNEDAIAKWEQKLNNARTTLANMKNDMDGVGDSMQTVSDSAAQAVVATTSIAGAMEKIGSAGASVADTIEGIFTGMIDRVADAVSQIFSMIQATAAKANNWVDLAGYWNTDAQTIQQWYRAITASGNSFDDLSAAVTKLAMGDRDKIKKLTGVSWVGDVDEWKYSMDVLSSIASMSHQQRNAALEQLFGEKRSTKVMDILGDWGKINELLPQFNGNETGYGMSDEELEQMSDVFVQLSTIEEKWNALKDNIAAGLGKATMTLGLDVEGAMDGVADFLAADSEEDREAALDKIRTNIENFFRHLGEILQEAINSLKTVGEELQGSDDPMTQLIGDIMTKLADALQWMVDHKGEVKAAFEAIFGAWLLAQLGAVAGKLAGIVASIKAIQLFKASQVASGAASAAASGASSGISGVGSWFSTVGGFLLKKALPAVGGFLLPFIDSLNNHGDDSITDENGNITEAAKASGWTKDTEGNVIFSPVAPKEFQIPESEKDERTEEEKAADQEAYWENRQRAAAEAMFDALKENGIDAWYGKEAEEMAYAFQNAPEKMDEVVDKITELLNTEDWKTREDLPAEWWLNGGQWSGATGNSQQDGITSGDLQSFRNLPAQLQRAAQNGTASGVSGIRVYLDGAVVGRLVAPYVSAEIAYHSAI